jgi:hypothetical protein
MNEIDGFANSFVIGCICFIIGLLIVCLDYILYTLQNTSFLKMPYTKGFKINLRNMIFWALGAGIVGFLLAYAKVLNYEKQVPPSIFVAICWPLIITQFVDKLNKQTQNKQDKIEQ